MKKIIYITESGAEGRDRFEDYVGFSLEEARAAAGRACRNLTANERETREFIVSGYSIPCEDEQSAEDAWREFSLENMVDDSYLVYSESWKPEEKKEGKE